MTHLQFSLEIYFSRHLEAQNPSPTHPSVIIRHFMIPLFCFAFFLVLRNSTSAIINIYTMCMCTLYDTFLYYVISKKIYVFVLLQFLLIIANK